MHHMHEMSPRERLVHHIQELERLEEVKKAAAEDLKRAFERAKGEGYDTATLKVVLRLRKMTPDQRRDRRALEAIYMASLGMLDGESLPDEARRRLDESREDVERPPERDQDELDRQAPEDAPSRTPEQPPLIVKDPEEARKEGTAAAAAGRRIYENPYPAGDPCRAAWDEGWCAQQRSHGMETPAAYQRRTGKPPGKDEKRDDRGGAGDREKGAA